MEATAAGLTTGALGAFNVVHGAAAQIALTGSTADLTSGATRVLTATLQDAAGNTVTSDNTTVVAFAKASGAGTSPAPATPPPQRRRDEDDHRRRSSARSRWRPPPPASPPAPSAPSPSSTAPPPTSPSPARPPTSPPAPRGVLTATLQDAAGNTVTSDSATVSPSPRRPAPAPSPAPATRPPQRRRHQDDHRRPRRLGHDGSHLRRAHHRHARRVHRRPRRRHQIVLTGSTANLTSGATRVLDGDDPGRSRQHRHLRQLDCRRLREGVRRRHGVRHRATRPPPAASRRRRSPDSSTVPSRWRLPRPGSRPATSAPSPSFTARLPTVMLAGSTADLTPARRGC